MYARSISSVACICSLAFGYFATGKQTQILQLVRAIARPDVDPDLVSLYRSRARCLPGRLQFSLLMLAPSMCVFVLVAKLMASCIAFQLCTKRKLKFGPEMAQYMCIQA